MGHVDGPAVANHLSHEGQGSAVIQVEVGDDDTVQRLSKVAICNEGEIGKPPLQNLKS